MINVGYYNGDDAILYNRHNKAVSVWRMLTLD